ncbi:MAG: chromate efflux transporter [Roseiarcus sp.]|uniref:chromate efflux transporter n=1 Tax=Roseiarcus sp. TaxID=1969460 RepID=UPI003C4D8739
MIAAVKDTEPRRSQAGSALEVLRVFLKLGLTSFGGPVAHLGYFRREFVVRRAWLDERAYADLVALCQFLPGPASSQTGFAIGLMRAGRLGGLAAWAAFTLPSAIAMTLFAYGEGALKGPAGDGLIHGLKLVAVAIVAQAVLGMAQSLTPDRPRAAIAVLSLILTAFVPAGWGQIAVILLGAFAGLTVCRRSGDVAVAAVEAPISRRAAIVFAGLTFALLALSFAPVLPGAAALAAAFYRSGALVFGGGHVVLPLLRTAVVDPGWVSANAFLAGYGAAQAMPGPLFTFAAYLGAVAGVGPGGVAGAALALVAIFAPGLLLLMAALPFWNGLRALSNARAAMAGVNAAVVGLLASALYDPVWTGAVRGPTDFAIAAAGFVALIVWRAPPLIVVIATAGAATALSLAGQS